MDLSAKKIAQYNSIILDICKFEPLDDVYLINGKDLYCMKNKCVIYTFQTMIPEHGIYHEHKMHHLKEIPNYCTTLFDWAYAPYYIYSDGYLFEMIFDRTNDYNNNKKLQLVFKLHKYENEKFVHVKTELISPTVNQNDHNILYNEYEITRIDDNIIFHFSSYSAITTVQTNPGASPQIYKKEIVLYTEHLPEIRNNVTVINMITFRMDKLDASSLLAFGNMHYKKFLEKGIIFLLTDRYYRVYDVRTSKYIRDIENVCTVRMDSNGHKITPHSNNPRHPTSVSRHPDHLHRYTLNAVIMKTNYDYYESSYQSKITNGANYKTTCSIDLFNSETFMVIYPDNTLFYTITQRDSIPEEYQCVICFGYTEKSMVLVPCGHTQYCDKCIQKVLEIGTCSICAQPVKQHIRIYN